MATPSCCALWIGVFLAVRASAVEPMERASGPAAVTVWKNVLPTLGLRAAAPTAVGLSLALTFGPSQGSPCPGRDPTGPSLSFEAGSGGGQIAVGVGTVCSPTRPFGIAGLALRAAYARTWGEPWSARSGQNYLGAYVEGTAIVTLRVGIMRHLGRDRPARPWLFVLGGGLGF